MLVSIMGHDKSCESMILACVDGNLIDMGV
jgi:hypothetical protein